MALKSLTPGTISKSRGEARMRLLSGNLAGIMLPLGAAEYTRTFSEGDKVEVFSPVTYSKSLIFSESDGQTGTGKLTLYNHGLLAKMFKTMSDVYDGDEAASVGLSVTSVVGDQASDIPLYARRVTNVIVSDAADDNIVYDEGTHYTVDSRNGAMAFVKVIAKPDGAGTGVKVDFDRLASKGKRFNIMTEAGFEAELIFTEATHPTADHEQETEVLRRCKCIMTDELVRASNGTDVATVIVSFEILADVAYPDSPYGYMTSGEKWVDA